MLFVVESLRDAPMSSLPAKWNKSPRPDPEVLALIDSLRKAAEAGEIRGLVAVTMNPMLDVETAKAGDCDRVRKRLLAAGLIEVSNQLLGKE